MSKVTSKLQVTIPKALAQRYGIRPGDRVRWEFLARGAVMVRAGGGTDSDSGAGLVGEGGAAVSGSPLLPGITVEERVALLDEAIQRQKDRERKAGGKPAQGGAAEAGSGRAETPEEAKDRRGWTREDLYDEEGPLR